MTTNIQNQGSSQGLRLRTSLLSRIAADVSDASRVLVRQVSVAEREVR